MVYSRSFALGLRNLVWTPCWWQGRFGLAVFQVLGGYMWPNCAGLEGKV